MLTPRENLQKIFRHEVPEWIPVCGHVDPYNQPAREGMDPALASALGTVRWHDLSSIHFSRHLGIDIMDYVGGPFRITRRNVVVERVEEGADTTEIWHTPRGDLRQVVRRCRDDGTSYTVRHLLNEPSDIPLLAAVFEDEQVETDRAALEAIEARQEEIGDGGMLMCFLAGTPLGMLYRVYSGVEGLAYLYADAPEALRDLFKMMEISYQRQFAAALGSKADIFVSMDDTSTTTISPAMFEACNMELTDQRAAMCHCAGKIYFHHSCGLIHDLLPLYRQTKMDAVHAFTIPPTGNVTVRQGRAALGRGITIVAGTVPLSNPTWDEAQLRAGIRQMFEEAAPGGHFILNLAAFPHRTMAQTRILVDECRRHQFLCR